MKGNLFRETWTNLDSMELRLLLNERIGGHGQYDEDPNKLYLPLARAECRIALTFRDSKIVAIGRGPAFDAAEWKRISEEIETSILAGPTKVGRDCSFSSYRVLGSWRGEHSGVQILPPPDDAPRAPVEDADHPFILEFPIMATDCWPVMNYRRMREHRNLTCLLNMLLSGRTRIAPRRPEHFWADVPREDGSSEIRWVQQHFFAQFGESVIDQPSPPAGARLEEVAPEEYYARIGHDGKGLRVPADLDQSICLYQRLSPAHRDKFNRAAFWFDLASRQWASSISSSFASLVSAVESLTDRGTTHQVYCKKCRGYCQHDVPGATASFRDLLEKYAPGPIFRSRRNAMYARRSRILHGDELMQLDQDRAFGWDPPWWNERELYNELWSLTRVALRNWLKNPPMVAPPSPPTPPLTVLEQALCWLRAQYQRRAEEAARGQDRIIERIRKSKAKNIQRSGAEDHTGRT